MVKATFVFLGSTRPGRRLCAMTMPVLVLRERAYRVLPDRQCLCMIIRLAVASRLPTTFGTMHFEGCLGFVACATANVCMTAGAAL